jgi:hypothetical protein
MTSAPMPASPPDLGLPPRSVRRRRGHFRIVVFRYLFTPAILLSVLWLATWLGIALLGPRRDARVTGFREEDAGGGGRTRFVQYKFDLDGQLIRDEQHMRGMRAVSWRIGDTVNVRTASILGYRYSTLADGWDDFIDFNGGAVMAVAFLLVFGLPWTIYSGWILPRRTRRLLQNGIVTTGTITELPPGPQRRCVYEFTAATGQKYSSSAALPPTAAAIRIGDPITVVHDATDPVRHVVYDLCEFEITGPAR